MKTWRKKRNWKSFVGHHRCCFVLRPLFASSTEEIFSVVVILIFFSQTISCFCAELCTTKLLLNVGHIREWPKRLHSRKMHAHAKSCLLMFAVAGIEKKNCLNKTKFFLVHIQGMRFSFNGKWERWEALSVEIERNVFFHPHSFSRWEMPALEGSTCTNLSLH
jgi:hypothetical protein